MSETVSTEQNQALLAELNELKAKYNALLFEFNQLKRLIFAGKRERFEAAVVPGQLSLPFEGAELAETAAPKTEQVTYTRKKNAAHKGRQPLPDHLPIEEIVIEPQEDTSEMKHIGDEVTETVDYTPGVLIKRRYIRRKYARMGADDTGAPAITIGELPYRPIAKGIAESGLLAHLLVSKYVDHLPFYRQIERFKREHDWNIQKSTLNDWFAACCSLLDPLYQAHKSQVLQTDYLQVDESPIKVLDIDKPKSTHQGYMWVYRNPVNGLVLFDYQRGRSTEAPKTLLNNFSGLLQCDGYAAYGTLARQRPDIRLVSCLAHIRRKFIAAQANHPALAEHALQQIQQLYALERQWRDEALNEQEIALRRQEEARPVYQALMDWVVIQHKNNLSKEAIGKALHYAMQELPQLATYLEDGRIQIDNNLIENAIRPMALGRKNYLFCGSHEGAERAAMMYSFFSSCKTLGVNPWEWLKDMLQRLENHPHKRITELLPGNWTAQG